MTDLAARAKDLDAQHAPTDRRSAFRIPEGVDLPRRQLARRAVRRRAAETAADVVSRQWGEQLIRAWNESDWWGAPERVGDRIGELVGAAPGQVVVHRLDLGQPLQGDRRRLADAPRPQHRADRPGLLPHRRLHRRSACDLLGLTLELVPLPRPRPGSPSWASHWPSRPTRRSTTAPASSGTCQRSPAQPTTSEPSSAGTCATRPVPCRSASTRTAPTSPSAAATSTSAADPGHRPSSTSRADHHAAFDNPLAGWQGHANPFGMSTDYDPAATITRARVGTAPLLSLLTLEVRSRHTTGSRSRTCGRGRCR